MKKSQAVGQETIANIATEDIHQIISIPLGGRTAVCQACDEQMRDGGRVTAYAVRPCRCVGWQAAQVRCQDHAPALDALATLGVQELVATGRVGRCTDQAHQRSWPVLLDPTVQSFSPRGTRAAIDAPSGHHPRTCPYSRTPTWEAGR